MSEDQLVCPKCKKGCLTDVGDGTLDCPNPSCEAQFALVDRDMLQKLLEDEISIVRATCHNILRQPMYGKKLQDTVIFHLKNFVSNIKQELFKDEA